jgi:hypothetical protein
MNWMAGVRSQLAGNFSFIMTFIYTVDPNLLSNGFGDFLKG